MVDEGAEALLARRPEGTGLAAAAGLEGQLAWPGTTAARIWSRGRMCPLPRRQVLGVPADLAELAGTGLMSSDGMARARQDLGLPATGRDGDVPVAAFVAARFGQEVVDRLVDPLLAGVYAGRSEELSFEATLPALAAESRKHASLAEAAGALLPEPGRARVRGSRACVHHPRRRPRDAARRGGRRLRRLRPHRRNGARAGPHGDRLAADRRFQARRGIPDGRRGHPGRPGQPRGAAAGRRARGVRRGDGARGDPLRQHGDRHLGLPGCGVSEPAGGQRLSRARCGRPPGQGGDVLHRQMAAPARRR